MNYNFVDHFVQNNINVYLFMFSIINVQEVYLIYILRKLDSGLKTAIGNFSTEIKCLS